MRWVVVLLAVSCASAGRYLRLVDEEFEDMQYWHRQLAPKKKRE